MKGDDLAARHLKRVPFGATLLLGQLDIQVEESTAADVLAFADITNPREFRDQWLSIHVCPSGQSFDLDLIELNRNKPKWRRNWMPNRDTGS